MHPAIRLRLQAHTVSKLTQLTKTSLTEQTGPEPRRGFFRTFAYALRYAITDIETTGGNAKTGKITEIAVYLHNGSKIIETYETLVNPGMKIPPFVTKLTGISNEMVADAPDFETVAAEIDAFTAGAVFVAHNVHFDYGFIREEFRRTGRDFKRRKLCTVQLSRSAFPGLASYSLDKVTRELGIVLNGHHRASADAHATALLFEKILAAESEEGLFDAHAGMPDLEGIGSTYIDPDFIRSIPDDPGIVRFYDAADTLIFSKRSANILTTVCEKLKQNQSKNSEAFRAAVHRIDYTLTGSQLLAQLLEAEDVMDLNPHFNHGKFSLKAHYAAVIQHHENIPYAVLTRRRSSEDVVLAFSNFFEGRDHLEKLAKTYRTNLREIKTGRRPLTALPLEHEGLLTEGISAFRGKNILTDEGRNATERTLIYIENGAVLGYGYADANRALSKDPNDDIAVRFKPFAELELAARKFVEKGRYEELIRLRT